LSEALRKYAQASFSRRLGLKGRQVAQSTYMYALNRA
jgi:hypothetical protein